MRNRLTLGGLEPPTKELLPFSLPTELQRQNRLTVAGSKTGFMSQESLKHAGLIPAAHHHCAKHRQECRLEFPVYPTRNWQVPEICILDSPLTGIRYFTASAVVCGRSFRHLR